MKFSDDDKVKIRSVVAYAKKAPISKSGTYTEEDYNSRTCIIKSHTVTYLIEVRSIGTVRHVLIAHRSGLTHPEKVSAIMAKFGFRGGWCEEENEFIIPYGDYWIDRATQTVNVVQDINVESRLS